MRKGAARCTATPGSISQLSAAWADGKRIFAVGIRQDDGRDRCLPTPAAILDGTYPLSRPLMMVTNGPPQGAAKILIDLLVSPRGQALVKKNGYEPAAGRSARQVRNPGRRRLELTRVASLGFTALAALVFLGMLVLFTVESLPVWRHLGLGYVYRHALVLPGPRVRHPADGVRHPRRLGRGPARRGSPGGRAPPSSPRGAPPAGAPGGQGGGRAAGRHPLGDLRAARRPPAAGLRRQAARSLGPA